MLRFDIKCFGRSFIIIIKVLDQFSSVTQVCPILCDSMDCSMPGFPVHHQLPETVQTHVHWVGDTIQPSHPLLSPSPPAFNLSQHQGLCQWANSSHQVVKVLEFQLQHQHQSFQWKFRLISFRIDWLHLFAVEGTLESLLQHHSSKASILWCSAFFVVQDTPGGSDGKASVYNVGDPGSSPGLGRSPREGNGNPLQYYCLENPIDRGAC